MGSGFGTPEAGESEPESWAAGSRGERREGASERERERERARERARGHAERGEQKERRRGRSAGSARASPSHAGGRLLGAEEGTSSPFLLFFLGYCRVLFTKLLIPF